MSLERGYYDLDMSVSHEQLELSPPQPEPVARAVAELVGEPGASLDPWWQAGLDEALDS